MSQKQPYCLMPWIHFHVSNRGMVKACCVANIPYGNINEKSLEEIWEGESVNKLRSKFLKGEKDNRCATCFKLEAAGGKSIRQETFEKFPQIKINNENSQLPIYFDIRFSNVCNFRCRTCWHGASSKWYSDAKQLGRNLGDKAILKNINDFDLFIEKCGAALLHAEEIYFAGGEPLVTEEHYLLLEWLIANQATQVRLRYNTNFSKLTFRNYDVIEMWKSFPEVEVLASIDGVGALGEYIRKEMNWEQMISNRIKINALPHIRFKISPTVSVFNIRHLPALYLECIRLEMIGPEDFYINILERPHYLNSKILSPEYKIIVKEEYNNFYQNHPLPGPIKAMFDECLSYMLAEDLSSHWEKFLTETSLLDSMRNENIENYISFEIK